MSVVISDAADGTGNVVVHDDLRVLFRTSRRGQQAAAARADAVGADASGQTSPVEWSETSVPQPETGIGDLFCLGPPTRYRLRCDGRRPVVFDGFALVERTIETPIPDVDEPVRQHFGLYLSAHGTIFARIAMSVPESLDARPLHKVAELGSNGELDRMIRRYDPAEGLAWSANQIDAPEKQERVAVSDLRHDFDRLIKAALGASPIRLQPETGNMT